MLAGSSEVEPTIGFLVEGDRLYGEGGSGTGINGWVLAIRDRQWGRLRLGWIERGFDHTRGRNPRRLLRLWLREREKGDDEEEACGGL